MLQLILLFLFGKAAIHASLLIDAFAGAGIHKLKSTGDWVLGSPLNALLVKPPFKEFHFIDLDGDKSSYIAHFD